jgi:hypothetical protein
MPYQTHDTMTSDLLQADQLADDWTTEVVARLPETFVQQAKALKAFERSRQLRSPADLLRGLLAYVYITHSFAHLSMWSVLIGLADVSATDWRKRVPRASAWGNWLLQEVLAASRAVARLFGANRGETRPAHRWHTPQMLWSSRRGLAGAYRL